MKSFVAAVFSLVISLSGCAAEFKDSEEDRYFQLATPRHYDVWVEHIGFGLSGVGHWSHPAGTMSCCWKGPDGPTGITGSLEPFPDFMAVQWFSLSERKFYQRVIPIKPEWKELMRELAPVKTSQGMFHRPRDFLVFGLAPGGEIVVWVMGQIGNEIEVGRLQANEIEGEPENYQSLLLNYQEKHGEYLRQNGIPLSGW